MVSAVHGPGVPGHAFVTSGVTAPDVLGLRPPESHATEL